MPNTLKLILLFLISTVTISCFKKDEQLIIIENKGTQNVKSLVTPNTYSIYSYSSFIDLDSGIVVKSSLISSWDLAFDTSPKGWKVLVNSANSKEIFPTGQTDFSANYSSSMVPVWNFDASSGNPDSTAIGKWVSENQGKYNYSKQVYLLGKNNGDGTYNILQKIVFIKLDASHIAFISALPDKAIADTTIINKDPVYRNVYYSFDRPRQTLLIEPPKKSWDIVAGSYRTTLYTSTGIATPYTVRGVLSNYPNIGVLKIHKPDFLTAITSDTTGKSFSYRQDAIGYDWKDYNSGDSNPYRIVPDLYYFVKTKSGNLIKLEFTGYTSANAEYGYPSLRLVKLN
jgi:hypothetical protein